MNSLRTVLSFGLLLLTFSGIFADTREREYELLKEKPFQALKMDEVLICLSVAPAQTFKNLRSLDMDVRSSALNNFFESMNAISISDWGMKNLIGVDFSIAVDSTQLSDLFNGVRPFIFKGIASVLESNTATIDPSYFHSDDLFVISRDGNACIFSPLLMGLSAKTYYRLSEDIVIDLFNLINSVRTNDDHVDYLFRHGFYASGESQRALNILAGLEISKLTSVHRSMRIFIISRMSIPNLKSLVVSKGLFPSDVDFLDPGFIDHLKNALNPEDIPNELQMVFEFKIPRQGSGSETNTTVPALALPPFYGSSEISEITEEPKLTENSNAMVSSSGLVLVFASIFAVFLF